MFPRPEGRGNKDTGKGFILMEDSFTRSDLSSHPQDGERIKNSFEEYLARKQPEDDSAKGTGANPPDEPDYEELFVRDAVRRAQDEELAALASLAVIRSGSDERSRMFTDLRMERIRRAEGAGETLKRIIGESEGRKEK